MASTSFISSARLAPFAHTATFAILLGALATSTAVFAAEGDHFIVGLGAANLPRYKGADERETKPVPLINVQQGRFFARTDAGIGLNVYQNAHVTVGASVNWMKGYKEEDAPAGIGEVKDALGGRVFVSTHLAGAIVTVSATQALSAKERGLQFDTRVSYPWRATDRLTVVHSVAVSAGNAKYMNTYFGVDSARSVQSGLPQYQAKAGVKEATVGTMASYRMTDRWAITGGVVAGQLLGDAAKSPIVRRKSNATGIVGVSYVF